MGYDYTGSRSLTLNSATPSVVGGGSFKEANTSATTWTGFNGGVKGDRLTLTITTSYTKIDGALTHTGMDIPLIAGDTLQFVYDGSNWKQIAGTVGMGVFVPLLANTMGGWIPASTTGFTDVDVSGDGVRKGAVAAAISIRIINSTAINISVYVRAKGAVNSVVVIDSGSVVRATGSIAIKLNDSAIFEAQHGVAVTTSTGALVGYYI